MPAALTESSMHDRLTYPVRAPRGFQDKETGHKEATFHRGSDRLNLEASRICRV